MNYSCWNIKVELVSIDIAIELRVNIVFEFTTELLLQIFIVSYRLQLVFAERRPFHRIISTLLKNTITLYTVINGGISFCMKVAKLTKIGPAFSGEENERSI